MTLNELKFVYYELFHIFFMRFAMFDNTDKFQAFFLQNIPFSCKDVFHNFLFLNTWFHMSFVDYMELFFVFYHIYKSFQLPAIKKSKTITKNESPRMFRVTKYK